MTPTGNRRGNNTLCLFYPDFWGFADKNVPLRLKSKPFGHDNSRTKHWLKAKIFITAGQRPAERADI
jgi:hypothetical protein